MNARLVVLHKKYNAKLDKFQANKYMHIGTLIKQCIYFIFTETLHSVVLNILQISIIHIDPVNCLKMHIANLFQIHSDKRAPGRVQPVGDGQL